MSLSGLDSPDVLAAYQTVLDNGGWFLLQYTARDAVDLLCQGIGEAVEMRDQAAQYFEKHTGPKATPLFGLVQLRRKRVLVKIACPDSSRLVQGRGTPFIFALHSANSNLARSQVHWGSISAAFPDHDSECELSNASMLSDSALVVNTDLHSNKATPVAERKPPLSGIDESAEEAAREARSRPTTADDTSKPSLTTLKSSPVKTVPQLVEPEEKEAPKQEITPTDLSHISALLLKPGEEPRDDAKPKDYLRLNDDFASPESNRRLSSMSSKTNEFEFFGSSLDFSFLDKPKVKLGPRPADNKRTASNRVSTDGRPSAALPAGLRSGRPISTSRPISRDSTMTVQPARFLAPPPIPESPTIQIPRPTSRSGSIKSLPATLPKSNTSSKEKQRLMKFREMYKQQGKKAKVPKVPKVPKDLQAAPVPAALNDGPSSAPQKSDKSDMQEGSFNDENPATIMKPSMQLDQERNDMPAQSHANDNGTASRTTGGQSSATDLEQLRPSELTSARAVQTDGVGNHTAAQSAKDEEPVTKESSFAASVVADKAAIGVSDKSQALDDEGQPSARAMSDFLEVETFDQPAKSTDTTSEVKEQDPIPQAAKLAAAEPQTEKTKGTEPSVETPASLVRELELDGEEKGEQDLEVQINPSSAAEVEPKSASEADLMAESKVADTSTAEPEAEPEVNALTALDPLLSPMTAASNGTRPSDPDARRPLSSARTDSHEIGSDTTEVVEQESAPLPDVSQNNDNVESTRHHTADDSAHVAILANKTQTEDQTTTPIADANEAAIVSQDAADQGLSASDQSGKESEDEGERPFDSQLDSSDLSVSLTDDDATPRARTSVTTPIVLSPTFGELTPERTTRQAQQKESAESALPAFEPSRESGASKDAKRTSKRLSFAALRLSIGSGLGLSTISLDNRTSTSTSNLTIDDELGDELEDAVVEVAQSLSVNNTPNSTAFPKVLNGFRSTSTPMKVGKAHDSASSESWNPGMQTAKARSASNHVPQVPKEIEITGPVAGKRVGGGIAAKIADLQRNFSRSTSTKSQSPSPTSTTHSTYAQRRAALNSSSGQPPTTPQKHTQVAVSHSLMSSLQTTPSQDEHPINITPSPPQIIHYHPIHNGTTTSTASASRTNSRVATPMSESIAFRTAVDGYDQSPFHSHHRTMTSLPSTPQMSSTSTMGGFHQRAKSAVVNPRQVMHPSARSSSVSSLHSGAPSSSKFDMFGIKRRSAEGNSGWRAFGRARGQSDSRNGEATYLPRNTSNSSLDTAESCESSKTDSKKQSRSSRLLKRMSSSISSLTAVPRSHLQTLNEKSVNNDTISRMDAKRPRGIVIGDLNVQFPDTLLWKRRWVEIDDHGFLIFKPNSFTENMNGAVKRFHMTEFQPPFPPDLDRQELPHSIILDLRDGRTLQCACQSPISQRKMLHMLLEYHMAWLS